MLKIENLNVEINGKKILNDFNLDIKDGEVHALMGVNGAGKSTLVKTISGHYDTNITSGTITYNGKDITDLSPDIRANEGIFLSFQSPVEVPGVNNSYFLKTAVNAKKVYNGKKELDSMEFMKLLKTNLGEYNLDNSLLKRGLNEGFSGGEKKKNELLQLLLLDPDMVMLDEIDSGLDVDAIKSVAEVINGMLAKDAKKSILMITHYDRLMELIKPDFVHILKDGKIVKTGDYSLALELDEKGFANLGLEDVQN
ncbi:MAG: Fe-S cluster assembly ATPase SufC [Arcobacter sp.]|nr:MAG: Fe-S cluster assembly ATPase SufC [Arcobacter sp.]